MNTLIRSSFEKAGFEFKSCVSNKGRMLSKTGFDGMTILILIIIFINAVIFIFKKENFKSGILCVFSVHS
jgi:hypothetical protein